MKKVFAILMTAIFCSICPVTAFAEESFDSYSASVDSVAAVEETPKEETYPTAGDLWIVWSKYAPDYICGIWSTDGSYENITFGIQNTEEGNAGKQEILDLVEDDSTVSFVYQKYSRNYLMQIQDSLLPYFEKNIGLVSAGLNEYENRIDLEIYEKKANDAATKEMVAELTNNLGDTISIGYTDQLLTLTTGPSEIDEIPDNSPLFFAILGMAALLILSLVFILYRRKTIPVLQTNSGQSVTAVSSLSHAQVEKLVQQSDMALPPDLDTRVMDAIEHATSNTQ